MNYDSLNTDTKVKFITNENVTEASLENSFGSLAKVLKVVLTQDFATKIPTEIEDLGNYKKIKFSDTHKFSTNQVIRCYTDESTFREYRVLDIESDSVTIKESSSMSTPTKVTGAPLGYSVVYDDLENTGTICFKNSSKKSPAILKLIDALPPYDFPASGFKFARVVAGNSITESGEFVDNMKTPRHPTDVNAEKKSVNVNYTGFGKWYYACRHEGDNWSLTEQSSPNYSFPRSWRLIGDSNTFYIIIDVYNQNDANSGFIYGFGLYKSEAYATDTKNIFICCSTVDIPYGAPYRSYNATIANMNNGLAASFAEHGNYIFNTAYDTYDPYLRFTIHALGMSDSQHSHNSDSNYSAIHPVTGKILTSDLYMRDSNKYYRGVLRGIKVPVGFNGFPDRYLFNNNENIALRYRFYHRSARSNENTNYPYVFSLKDWE